MFVAYLDSVWSTNLAGPHICCFFVVGPGQSFLEATFDKWHALCRNLYARAWVRVSTWICVRKRTCISMIFSYVRFSVKMLLVVKMLLFKYNSCEMNILCGMYTVHSFKTNTRSDHAHDCVYANVPTHL